MPRRRTIPYFIRPNDPEVVIIRKLQRLIDTFRNDVNYKRVLLEPSGLGRPAADWHADAYENYRKLRNEGTVEKVAVAKVAENFSSSDDAIAKAMRVIDDAKTEDFYEAMLLRDAARATKEFLSLDPYIRLRFDKQLRKYRK